MGADRPELTSNQEISWRLKELGPELRRALFEQALHPHGALADTLQGKNKRRPAGPETKPAAAKLQQGGRPHD
jgi:hypothetical protein